MQRSAIETTRAFSQSSFLVRYATAALASALLVFALAASAGAHADPESDGLIDGGGSAKTDCVSKFQTGLELNYPAAPKKSSWLACVDGDLSCDLDGDVNGACLIGLGMCLADDDDAPECVPAGLPVGGVVVKNKSSNPDPDLTALQSEIDEVLGASGLPCINPGMPPGNCFACTDDQVMINIDRNVKGGKKKIKIKAATDPAPPKNKPIKDNDKLKMRCLECENPDTFEHLAKIVFQANCAGSAVCHGGGSPAAGMNLDYEEVGLQGLHDILILDDPTSPGAAALGMRRILPSDPGLETTSSSLILEKVRLTNSGLDDICNAGSEPDGCLGVNMPPGSDSYSTGKIELLKAWIADGAPLTGHSPGATCGEPEDIWNPATPLDPPPAGQGFQVHFPAPAGFEVAPGTEYEGCQWIEIPASITQTMYINKIEMRANSGTHHLIVYDDQPDGGPPAVPTAFDPDDGLCNKQFGLKSFFSGTQDAEFTDQLPVQVSHQVEPGTVYGINTHYTNPFNVPIYPEVWINFWGTTTPTAKTAINIFPGDLAFSIPPGTAGEGNLLFYNHSNPTSGCFYFLTSHQHRRGTGAKIWTSQPSGWADTTDQIFYSTDWDHPDELKPIPRLVRQQGERLYFQCQWDNGVLNDVTRRCRPLGGVPNCLGGNDFVCFTNADCGAGTTGSCEDCQLDFGFLAEDEMCFIPGFYYESDPGDSCPY